MAWSRTCRASCRAGSTAIGEALKACEQLLKLLPAPARRQVIDMVGDGRSNDGDPPGPIRDRLAAAGVTINGLCVLHEEPDLLRSYTREVIGGPGAFVLQCQDYQGFAEAMRQKLARRSPTGKEVRLGRCPRSPAKRHSLLPGSGSIS